MFSSHGKIIDQVPRDFQIGRLLSRMASFEQGSKRLCAAGDYSPDGLPAFFRGGNANGSSVGFSGMTGKQAISNQPVHEAR